MNQILSLSLSARYNEPDHDGSWVSPGWAAAEWANMEVKI